MSIFNNRKNNLDEYQEQQLLKIEHNGCWFAFWALFVGTMYESAMEVIRGTDSFLHVITPTKVVFFALAIYLSVACTKHGIWDRHLKADNKTNNIVSLIGGLFVLLYVLGISAAKGFLMEFPVVIILAALFSGGCTYLLIIATLTFSMKKYQKQVEKLEKEDEEFEEEK